MAYRGFFRQSRQVFGGGLMLVDFEVENFRSYRQAKRLSMVASSARELPRNLIDTDVGLQLVRSAVLYGANASGKSNLLAAMDCVSGLLETPMNRGMPSLNTHSPFALDRTSGTKPSRFRVRFLISEVLYDYSVSIRVGLVDEERLIVYPHGRPQEWFHRKGKEIDFNSTHLKGQKQSLRSVTPPDVPLLSVAAAFEHPQLHPPSRWLRLNLCDHFNMLRFRPRMIRPEMGGFESAARRCHEDQSFRLWMCAFLRHADLGVQGLEIDVVEMKSGRPVYREGSLSTVEDVVQNRYVPYFSHTGDDEITARFGLANESQGTQRLFAMMPHFFEVLRDGRLTVIDDVGAGLHPSLVRELIRAFHDPELNPKGAQLVFATHDTSLLSGKLFRRDQVWFTEKDGSGATDLYSLNDIKGVREDESFEKGYMRGRYGAIPFFGSFDFPPVSQEPAEAAT